MARAGRTPTKTAAERQRLERERNRRAKEAISALSNFATNGAHWDQQRFQEPHEILGTVLLVTKWAMQGDGIINEWRLTLDGGQRARTARILGHANIFLPFCTKCGADLPDGASARCQNCLKEKAA